MKKVFDTNAEYHSHKSISASGLKSIAKFNGSVREYLAQTYAPKKAFDFGNAVHTLFTFGRDQFDSEYYEMPELGDMRKKENKELKEALMTKAGDRNLLDHSDVRVIRELERQFYANPLAVESCTGVYELSHYTEYGGVPVRVRADIINEEKGFITDIKTTRSVMDFHKDVWQYNYHIQAAFYCTILGFPIENFRFVAMKNNIQYSDQQHPETMIRVCRLNDKMIEKGFEGMHKAFDRWKHYVMTGVALGADTLKDDYGLEIL
jgi:hypothetical protein